MASNSGASQPLSCVRFSASSNSTAVTTMQPPAGQLGSCDCGTTDTRCASSGKMRPAGEQHIHTHMCVARLCGHSACSLPCSHRCAARASCSWFRQKQVRECCRTSQKRWSCYCNSRGADHLLAVAAAAGRTCLPPSRCSLWVWKCSCCGTALTVTVLCPGLSPSELSTDLPAAGQRSTATAEQKHALHTSPSSSMMLRNRYSGVCMPTAT
jgi:hypothetical protein